MFTYNITSDLINNDSLEKTEQKSDISKDQNHRINCNSSILLIGNGFDLRAKIKSSFSMNPIIDHKIDNGGLL